MPAPDVPPEVLKALPGALGSIVALRWIPGTLMQRATAVCGGAAGAYYGTPHLSNLLGTDAGLTGFLIGLFGMAVAAKCFELIALIDPGAVLEKLRNRWGL